MTPSQHSGFGGFLFFSFHSLDCSRLSQIKLRGGVDRDDLGVPYRIDEDPSVHFTIQHKSLF